MSSATIRGSVQNGTVTIGTASPQLKDGTQVLVVPIDSQRGHVATVLAALQRSPAIPNDWIDELESIIAGGQLPVSHDNPLSESGGN